MIRILLLIGFCLIAKMAQAASCTSSVANLNFGAYTGASTNGTTAVTLNCTSGATFNIGVDGGQNSGGTFYNWNMSGPNSSLINYHLYRDAARTQYLGGTVGSDTIQGTGTGSSQTVYIYAGANANTAVVPGSYSDSVVVSVYVSGGTTSTPTMSVTATVTAQCSVSVSPLSFGIYTAAQIDLTTSVSATCTNTTTYSVNMDQGLHYSSFYNPRMIGPSSNYLSYHLYRDSARTMLWGNTANYDGDNGTGTGSPQSYTVYARCSGGQYVTPGSYADTITVTINY